MLQFLKDKYDESTDISVHTQISELDLREVNQMFSSVQVNSNRYLRMLRKPAKYQIWTIKNDYYDFLGSRLEADHPFIVVINKDEAELEKEAFIRVFVISPFVEFASENDIICTDPSIIGFPFLIETWNDQPVLSEILNEYLGDYYFEDPVSSIQKLTATQEQFRKLEIARSGYLTHSVQSLIYFLEHRQSLDMGVSISFLESLEFPDLYPENEPSAPNYSYAARYGIDTENKYVKHTSSAIPFDIVVKKSDDGYVLTIQPESNVKLYSSKEEEVPCLINDKKQVFNKLKFGLYFLRSNHLSHSIKIRIK